MNTYLRFLQLDIEIVNDKNKNITFNEYEMDGIDEEIEGFTYNNDY